MWSDGEDPFEEYRHQPSSFCYCDSCRLDDAYEDEGMESFEEQCVGVDPFDVGYYDGYEPPLIFEAGAVEWELEDEMKRVVLGGGGDPAVMVGSRLVREGHVLPKMASHGRDLRDLRTGYLRFTLKKRRAPRASSWKTLSRRPRQYLKDERSSTRRRRGGKAKRNRSVDWSLHYGPVYYALSRHG